MNPVTFIPTCTPADIQRAHWAWLDGDLASLAVTRKPLGWVKPKPKANHSGTNAARSLRKIERQATVRAFVVAQQEPWTITQLLAHMKSIGMGQYARSTISGDLNLLMHEGLIFNERIRKNLCVYSLTQQDNKHG